MQTVLNSNLNLARLRRNPDWTSQVFEGGSRGFTEREILTVRPETDRSIRCASGCVWITDGDHGDVILRKGETFLARRGSRVIMEALAPSVVEG